jgi:hypothetical protein
MSVIASATIILTFFSWTPRSLHEAHAGLAHVKLLARCLERLLQLCALLRVAVRAHQVQRVVILLRGKRRVTEGLPVVGVG